MIASYKHNFIFIKTKKTASTSIELALGEHCGPEDILTTLSKHGFMRAERGVFPRHFSRSPELERVYCEALARQDKRALRRTYRELRAAGSLAAHAKATTVRNWVGHEFWDRAFKFTSERHPYEKAVSYARMTAENGIPFETHLDQTVFGRPVYVGHTRYMEDGKILVDGFVRQDRLAGDMQAVLARLGLPPVILPHARRRSSSDTRPAADVLTPAQRAFVYERCAPEFELFGWAR